MGKSNDLRLLIQERLNSIKTEYGLTEISYKIANDAKMYPHIVYDFTSITPMDMGRSDYLLDISIWAKDQFLAFDIADTIRELFQFWNAPNNAILPTFYEMSFGEIEDPDKSIVHLVMRLECQVYETGVTDSGILRKE